MKIPQVKQVSRRQDHCDMAVLYQIEFDKHRLILAHKKINNGR